MSRQTAPSVSPGPARSAASDDDLTLSRMFRQTAARVGRKTALMARCEGEYRGMSYAELQDEVNCFAAALLEQGLAPGDRVALLAENSPNWVITDMGTLAAGGCDVPLYPTLTPQQIGYILADCGARYLVIAGHLAEKLAQIEQPLPALAQIIVVGEPQGASAVGEERAVRMTTAAQSEPSASTRDDEAGAVPRCSMQEFLDRGRAALARQLPEIDRRVAAAGVDDLASIIYTSGTTGEPKGVMLTHRNFVFDALGCARGLSWLEDELELSFLPLCHVFGRVAYNCGLYMGTSIAYAESVLTVAANLTEVHPTIMAAVPALFEKIHARITADIRRSRPLRRRIFAWAMQVGRRRLAAIQLYGGLPPLLQMEVKLADRLVFSKIHERMGGQVRWFISGGAPLRRDIAEFFAAAGLYILEGYGLTETSPVIAVNTLKHWRIGTVGRPLPGVEVRIADDGEILTRGPHVMKGYWNKPEATAEAIDQEGWFHTGDVGELDADGYLRITDRKKELLVLANGKNVAPQAIENLLKSSPYIEQAVALGDNHNFVVALIVPAFEQLKAWAAEQRIGNGDQAELCRHAAVRRLLQGEVSRLNEQLATHEQVERFAVLPRELAQDQGELTPTLKLIRRTIASRFTAEIAELFA